MARKSKTLPDNFEALCQAEDCDALKAVFDHCAVDARDAYLKRPASCFPDCPDALIRWLVAQGLHIDSADRLQRTPLLLRAQFGKDLMVLIELGANVNAMDHEGCTALHQAVQFLQTVTILLDHDADGNIVNKVGDTPLHNAAWLYPQTVKILLDHSVDVNAANRYDVTPLHNAAANPCTTKLLIAHGAQINAQDRWGRTPLATALLLGAHDSVKAAETAQLLLDAGATVPANVRRRLRRIWRSVEDDRQKYDSKKLPDNVAQALQAAQSLYQMFGFRYPTS